MKAEVFMFIDQVLLAAGAIGVYVWFRRPEQKLKESQDMTLRCFDHLWSVRVLLQYSFFKLSWQPRLQMQKKITLLGTNTSPNKVLLSRWFCFSPGGIYDRSLVSRTWLTLIFFFPADSGPLIFRAGQTEDEHIVYEAKAISSGADFWLWFSRHFYVQPISIFNQIILCWCH